MRGISCNFDNIKTLRTGNRLVQQQNNTVNAETFIIKGSKKHNFLENRKILAENGEKIIQFSFENHRKSV
jgi:hypothetical protein